jgi:hypothetical protein
MEGYGWGVLKQLGVGEHRFFRCTLPRFTFGVVFRYMGRIGNHRFKSTPRIVGQDVRASYNDDVF